MGLDIKNILEYKPLNISELGGKKIAIDVFNMIFQFLSSIRQPDGRPLMDSTGNVTSHLKGLFNRCVYFKKNNINAVFVFDGKAPSLKEKERVIRVEKKMKLETKYRDALERGDIEEAKKYASSTSRITPEIIEESKKLISLFGFPVIQALSEGEAEAAFLNKKGLVWSVASQDFDTLLFGANYLIRNLSIGGKRKIKGSNVYVDVDLEFYDLNSNLEKLGISYDELIVLGVLVGTDFNPGGIKGIGPKKALKLVKSYRDNWEELFKNVGWYDYFEYPWIDVINIFRNIDVNLPESLKFNIINKGKIVNFLVNKDFDEDSVKRSLDKIKNIKTLDNFFNV